VGLHHWELFLKVALAGQAAAAEHLLRLMETTLVVKVTLAGLVVTIITGLVLAAAVLAL
jgi:hypothetical protein